MREIGVGDESGTGRRHDELRQDQDPATIHRICQRAAPQGPRKEGKQCHHPDQSHDERRMRQRVRLERNRNDGELTSD